MSPDETEPTPESAEVPEWTERRKGLRGWRLLGWIFGVPFVILLALYVRLLFGPLPLPLVSEQAQNIVHASLADNLGLELGGTALALEGPFTPVIQFSPVKLTDSASGAIIEMSALEIGLSGGRMLSGQRGVTITLVAPKVQIIQDLFGPRPATFELIEGDTPGDAMIKVTNGEQSLPPVKISASGVNIQGRTPDASITFRSDNDWLITNLLAMEQGLRGFAEQSTGGALGRLVIRDGTLQMHDAVYGLYREFTAIDLTLSPSAQNVTSGAFKATLSGRTSTGTLTRTEGEDGQSEMVADIKAIDFASFVPFIDDPDGVMAIKGAGDLVMDVKFADTSQKVQGGSFDVNLSGTDLRINQDMFPVTTRNIHVDWHPEKAEFDMSDGFVQIGASSSHLNGVFVLGLDKVYGPTVSMSIEAMDLALNPNDMQVTAEPFTAVAFSGWAATLYGAIGVDELIASKPGTTLRTKGRVDMLRSGIGMDLDVSGEGASADDLKRIWPYFVSTGARDWFVKNVTAGNVETGSMKLKFPVGSLATGDEDKPVPPGALTIDLTALGVGFRPIEAMDPIAVAGKSYLEVRDNTTTARMDGAVINTTAGNVQLGSAAFIIDTEPNFLSTFEISGDVSGSIPALVELAKERAPDMLQNADLPVNLEALSGNVTSQLVATVVVGAKGEVQSLDYGLNGEIADFASSEPIQSYTLDKGALSFRASPDDFRLGGTANVEGVPAELVLSGKIGGETDTVLSATLSIEELKSLGFDASTFLDGKIRFAAKLIPDGPIQLTADLTDASVTVTDLGLSKKRGVEGSLNAEILQDGTSITASKVSVAFGDVKLVGDISVDTEKGGLQTANFSQFALSEGDNASMSVAPIDGGIALTLRGEQFDLKPMLKRFFALDQSSTGGPQSTQFQQALEIDAKLDRAVGYYRTTAYGFDLKMRLKGETLQRVNLQAQFAEGNNVSVTTNQVPNGRALSVAFNDAGTILRFLNVYSQLAGGSGSIVMTTDRVADLERGEIRLNDFQIVDEEKVAEILGNHQDSKALIARENRIAFNRSNVSFIRRSDRVEVTEALLDGGTVGGTLRGFVYTKERRYDLVGTYVPLFGINSIFQKLPIIGEVLGGRDGEGLVGVTFAVRGDLDKPQFLVNPVSILVPGAFRALFEYRAKEAPREEK